MKAGIPPLIIGNWKMNPQSLTLAAKLGGELKKVLHTVSAVEVVIAPPYVYLESIKRILGTNKGIMLGAQNVSCEKMGPHTGDTSLSMLQSFEVTHVILGHSERRALGEKDERINLKLLTTIKSGLTGVVCVGETKRDHNGHYLTQIETQIRKALAKVSRNRLSQVVIAYEPVWAIGTGDNATPEHIYEMKLFIEKVLSDIYGRNFAQKIRIIYGGSVHAKNVKELFEQGMVDGFLVGEASLCSEEFRDIIKAVIKL